MEFQIQREVEIDNLIKNLDWQISAKHNRPNLGRVCVCVQRSFVTVAFGGSFQNTHLCIHTKYYVHYIYTLLILSKV